MHGYSDRINHAFAFAAKYYNVLAPAGAGVDYLAHPANVAVILSRYGCEQVTIVAGILHHVLEESPPVRRCGGTPRPAAGARSWSSRTRGARRPR
jgi:(p)ppGpp synthase/HD superfamily hydrolase